MYKCHEIACLNSSILRALEEEEEVERWGLGVQKSVGSPEMQQP